MFSYISSYKQAIAKINSAIFYFLLKSHTRNKYIKQRLKTFGCTSTRYLYIRNMTSCVRYPYQTQENYSAHLVSYSSSANSEWHRDKSSAKINSTKSSRSSQSQKLVLQILMPQNQKLITLGYPGMHKKSIGWTLTCD